MNNIEEFCAASKRDEHHELCGSKNRIEENVTKLGVVLRDHNTNFDELTCVYNTVTKKVLEPSLAEQFLAHILKKKQTLCLFCTPLVLQNEIHSKNCTSFSYFSTVFRMVRFITRRDINVKTAYKVLGAERVNALLGCHEFTGCDQTGKFASH